MNIKGMIVPVICVFVLAGCRSGGGVVEEVPRQPVLAPADALVACPALDVSLGEAGLADLARALQGVAEQYHECRSRHGQLVEWYERQVE